MKKLIAHNEVKPDNLNIGLLLLQVAASCFMLTHAWPKFSQLLAGREIRFGDPIGIGATASLVLAVFAESFCSVLVTIVFGTRLATIPLMVTMCVAGFIGMGDAPFTRKELALLYLVIYIFLFISGAGKYSVDEMIYQKK